MSGQRAFFFDFDETLFSHHTKRIPSSALDALAGLQAQGHLVAIATGRGPESMAFIERELGFPCDYMIVLNGQLVYRGTELVEEQFIRLPSMDAIIGIAKQSGIAYGGYCAKGVVVNQMSQRVKAVWRDFSCPLPAVQENFESIHSLYQGHLYCTEDELSLFAEPLEDYIINRPHPVMINLIAREGGKSRAINHLLVAKGIAKEYAYGFGDGFNDLDMLLAVGHGVAMGNAATELKAAAEYVTGTAEEDGIVNALKHYALA